MTILVKVSSIKQNAHHYLLNLKGQTLTSTSLQSHCLFLLPQYSSQPRFKTDSLNILHFSGSRFRTKSSLPFTNFSCWNSIIPYIPAQISFFSMKLSLISLSGNGYFLLKSIIFVNISHRHYHLTTYYTSLCMY